MKATSSPSHEPLSQRLAALLDNPDPAYRSTVNALLARTEGRGVYLVMMLLSLPFVLPVSIPGTSTILGPIVILLALGRALHKPAMLPAFIGNRPLPDGLRRRLLGGGVRFLRWVERWVKPRRTVWLDHTWSRILNNLLLACLGLLLSLPLPSPPFFFTNTLPAYAIILVAASLMEEDGVLIFAGYAMVGLNVVYFTLIGGLLTAAGHQLWQRWFPG
jgi:hypothetical protein